MPLNLVEELDLCRRNLMDARDCIRNSRQIIQRLQVRNDHLTEENRTLRLMFEQRFPGFQFVGAVQDSVVIETREEKEPDMPLPQGTRIEATDSPIIMAIKVAGGNPGAATVCMQLLKQKDGYLDVILLDTGAIWGADVWILYKDLCGQDIPKMRNVLNAAISGVLSWEHVHGSIAAARDGHESGPKLDHDAIAVALGQKPKEAFISKPLRGGLGGTRPILPITHIEKR